MVLDHSAAGTGLRVVAPSGGFRAVVASRGRRPSSGRGAREIAVVAALHHDAFFVDGFELAAAAVAGPRGFLAAVHAAVLPTTGVLVAAILGAMALAATAVAALTVATARHFQAAGVPAGQGTGIGVRGVVHVGG